MARGDLKTFDYYPYNAGLKLYNNSTDSFKYAIVTDTYASVLKTTVDPVLTSFTEVGAGGNYSAGGVVSAGVTALAFTNVSMLKAAGNPTTGKTVLIINSTATNRGYHAIDLTSDGTTAVDLVNNDLTITFNANGTVNATVTA